MGNQEKMLPPGSILLALFDSFYSPHIAIRCQTKNTVFREIVENASVFQLLGSACIGTAAGHDGQFRIHNI